MGTCQSQDNILKPEEGRRFRLGNANACWASVPHKRAAKRSSALPVGTGLCSSRFPFAVPASSSGQAAYNSKGTIVILSPFPNVQFEIRAGGGRKRLEEPPSQLCRVQSASLVLNPYLVVPITAPQNICFSKGIQAQTHFLCPADVPHCWSNSMLRLLVLPQLRRQNLGKLVSNHESNTKHLPLLARQAKRK